jgi:acyl dehydratase
VESLVENTVDNSGKTDITTRSLESFEVGETHQSPDQVMLQKNIDAFAHLTGDLNPIHLDPEFAEKTVFRSTVAHGLYLSSILAGMAFERGLLGRNILALEQSHEDYLQAVKPGDVIFGRVTIASKDPDASKRCGRIAWNLELLRRDGEEETVVVQAVWRTLVFKDQYLP